MAIKLLSKPNVDGVSASYPYGNIRDNPGDNTGTPVSKEVYADFHQFFERLMAQAGVTHNGNPDNATFGFQYIQALEARMAQVAAADVSLLNVNGGTKLNKTIVDIGDWNMDADATKNVTHGVADFTKIRQVTAVVRNDADNNYSPLDAIISGNIPGGVNSFNATTVVLNRVAGGFYDNSAYDSTSYNRGWIVIEHLS